MGRHPSQQGKKTQGGEPSLPPKQTPSEMRRCKSLLPASAAARARAKRDSFIFASLKPPFPLPRRTQRELTAHKLGATAAMEEEHLRRGRKKNNYTTRRGALPPCGLLFVLSTPCAIGVKPRGGGWRAINLICSPNAAAASIQARRAGGPEAKKGPVRE